MIAIREEYSDSWGKFGVPIRGQKGQDRIALSCENILSMEINRKALQFFTEELPSFQFVDHVQHLASCAHDFLLKNEDYLITHGRIEAPQTLDCKLFGYIANEVINYDFLKEEQYLAKISPTLNKQSGSRLLVESCLSLRARYLNFLKNLLYGLSQDGFIDFTLPLEVSLLEKADFQKFAEIDFLTKGRSFDCPITYKYRFGGFNSLVHTLRLCQLNMNGDALILEDKFPDLPLLNPLVQDCIDEESSKYIHINFPERFNNCFSDNRSRETLEEFIDSYFEEKETAFNDIDEEILSTLLPIDRIQKTVQVVRQKHEIDGLIFAEDWSSIANIHSNITLDIPSSKRFALKYLIENVWLEGIKIHEDMILDKIEENKLKSPVFPNRSSRPKSLKGFFSPSNKTKKSLRGSNFIQFERDEQGKSTKIVCLDLLRLKEYLT